MDSVSFDILIVEDEPGHAVAIQRAFAHVRPQDTVMIVGSLKKCRDVIATAAPDVIVTDMRLPDGKAFELLNSPGIAEKFPFIVMTSYGNEAVAVEAIKSGAIEYVVKSPEAFTEMPRTVERVMREWSHVQEVKKTREALALSQAELSAVFDGTPVMLCVIDSDRRVLNANRAFHDFVRLVGQDVLQQRPCGILGCLRALDDPAGCGFGPCCGKCSLRIAMTDTLRSGTVHIDVECEIPVRRNGVEQTVVFLGSITPMPQAGDSIRALVSLLDITERRQAEDALRFSEEKISGILDAIDDAVLSYSLIDNSIIYCSPSCSKLFGRDVLVDFQGDPKAWVISVHPDDFLSLYGWGDQLDGSGLFYLELRILRPDGSCVWVYGRHKLVYDATGRPVRYDAMFSDITARRLTEDALRSSEAKVTGILNTIDDAVISYSLDNHEMLYASPSCSRIFGQDIETLFQGDSRAWISCVHPDDMPGVYEGFMLLEANQSFQIEFRIIRPDGSFVWVYSRHRIISEPGSDSLRYQLTLTDITASRQAEDALRKSEEKVSSVLNAIDDAIISYSIKDACLSYISPSCMHFFGRDIVSEISIDPRDWACFVLPDDLPVLYASVDSLYDNGTAEAECRLRRPDGSIIWVLARQKLVYDPETGQAGRFDLMLTDITDRKNADIKLRESQASLARSQEVGHIGSWHFDVATQMMVWSDELYRLLGLWPDEHAASYEVFFEIVHPDDMPEAQVAFSDFFSGNKDSLEYVHRIIRKDTSEMRYVYERCVHERDADGMVIRSIGTIQDITERKQAEEKAAEHLSELEQWYRVTLNREDRVLELKAEINKLLERLGEQRKYGEDE